MARKGDGLTTRPDSDNLQWQYVVPKRFRGLDPSAPAKVVRTTGTSDRAKARIISAPWREQALRINDYLQSLLEKRFVVDSACASPMGIGLRWKMEPGTSKVNDDGSLLVAIDQKIVTWSADRMSILKEEPNVFEGVVETLKVATKLSGIVHFSRPLDSKDRKASWMDPDLFADAQFAEPQKRAIDLDFAIIDCWVSENRAKKNIRRYEAEARKTIEIFREIIPGITFAKADYSDGRALVMYLKYELEYATATVRKKISFLRSAVNEAKLRPKDFPAICHRDNPFSKVLRKLENDQLDRVRFDEDDIRLMLSRLDELGRNESILLVWCIATGCRRGEPFTITREFRVDGHRMVFIGEYEKNIVRKGRTVKTEDSKRKIPLPPILQELYPEPISGPLFTDTPVNIGKRLNKWIRTLGITDKAKTLHSTRHRASHIFRGAEKDSLRWTILGHENLDKPSEGYSEAPPAEQLQELIKLWPQGCSVRR